MSAVKVPSAAEVERERTEFERARAERHAADVERDQQERLEAHRDRVRPREDVDLDAILADATARLEELREQQGRLAPESLVDDRVASALKDVESEIESCEATIRRVPLARAEAERRREEAERLAESRRPLLAEARKLAEKRAKQAEAVDQAARAFAEALQAWDRTSSEQESVLRRAGRDGAAVRPRRWAIEAGLMRALVDAGCPRGIVVLETFTGPMPTLSAAKVAPLAEVDAAFGLCQLPEGKQNTRGR